MERFLNLKKKTSDLITSFTYLLMDNFCPCFKGAFDIVNLEIQHYFPPIRMPKSYRNQLFKKLDVK